MRAGKGFVNTTMASWLSVAKSLASKAAFGDNCAQMNVLVYSVKENVVVMTISWNEL